jgi:SPP1 gp7 family putative phage head morphogenesis protein
MIRIDGVSHLDSERRGDDFHRLIVSKVGQTLHTVVRHLGRVATLDDLGPLLGYWTKHVDQQLVPYLRNAYQAAATDQAKRIRAVLTTSLIADADPALDEDGEPDKISFYEDFDLPVVSNTAAEMYMADARNRLVNVGNDVWEEAREQLLDGLKAGEGIDDIQIRIFQATDLTEARAGVVARTEINGALNAGTIAQMRMIDVNGMTKQWLAVNDNRTRETHRAADGQIVAMNQPFIVGGSSYDTPGLEPNCRCTMGFDLP